MLDEATIGFADFSGNRQYLSIGNIASEERVSLLLMDYPNRTRPKILGRARVAGLDDVAALARLSVPDYRARVERGRLVDIKAFDWNCPQQFTPRVTIDEIAALNAAIDENQTGRTIA